MAILPLVPNRGGEGKFLNFRNRETGIVAHAGGGQANGRVIGAGINRVDTVASQGDSIKLPKINARPEGFLNTKEIGLHTPMLIWNNSTNQLQLFGATLDTIMGFATGTGAPISPGTACIAVPVDYTQATNVGTWVLAGAYGQAGMLWPFGSGTALIAEEGNIYRQISSAGINPGATGADNVLAVYSLPANSFDISGRGITITAQGSFGATGNNKDVKIIFNPSTAVVGSTVGAGGTTISDTGVVTTNNLGWSVQANVFKYGAAGSNTQIGLHQQAQIGAAVASMLKPSLITAVENAAILIAITGNATTATTDIALNFFEVNAMN